MWTSCLRAKIAILNFHNNFHSSTGSKGMPASLVQKASRASETPQPTRTPSGQPNHRKIALPEVIAKTACHGKMTPPAMNAAIPERKPATEEISGLVERVTFHTKKLWKASNLE
jgi:hypothetical protein